MPWTAAAIVVGAGITAYGAHEASKNQAGAAEGSFGLTQGMFDQIRSDLLPFMQGGQEAMGPLLDMLGITREGGMSPEAIQKALEKLPGYQFTKQQGLNAVNNAFGARGLGLSGAQAKGIADFATGLADTTFGNQFNRLLDMVRLGESAATHTGTFGTEAASQMGNALMFGGNARAAGILGATNAAGGGLNSLAQMQMFNNLLKNNGYQGLYGNTQNPDYTGFTFSEPTGP